MEFGVEPDYLRLRLSNGASFTTKLKLVDSSASFTAPPWLSFTVPDLADSDELVEIVWTSTLSELNKTASWFLSPTEVDQMILRSRNRKVRLFLDGDILWAEGYFEVGND